MGLFCSSIDVFAALARGVGLLYSSSIERGAQRFVSQAICRANDSNLEWSDTGVFEYREASSWD